MKNKTLLVLRLLIEFVTIMVLPTGAILFIFNLTWLVWHDVDPLSFFRCYPLAGVNVSEYLKPRAIFGAVLLLLHTIFVYKKTVRWRLTTCYKL